jgi:fucose permease
MTATDARRTPGPAQVRAATRATYAAFIGSGFAFASWASRIPQVRNQLHLSPAELGLVLLAIAAGSVVALPLSGPLIARFGSRRTVILTSLLLAAALAVAAVGSHVGVVLLVVGLFLMGVGNGAWDVAMNVQAAVVERLLGRAIMSRFHAGFSLGTVAGAGIGALMIALHVPVTAHLLGVAVLVGAAVPLSVRNFAPDVEDSPAQDSPDQDGAPVTSGSSALRAWREPRTLLIGVFVLAFAFAEGAANDWISVASIDGHGTSAVVGTLGYAVFLVAMTAVRWAGPPLLERWGRVPMVRVLALLSVTGLLLFVFGPHPAVAFAGALLWGAGASLGFPVGMSAAADDPTRAAGRVSVVASIGYCAFLGGPPLIGVLGQSVGVLHALTVVAVLLALATAIAGALRPPPGFSEQGV